ncbi:hypothetical protein RHEC894_CH02113 [Rhizobium sp. CIAT894]|nr:hypothetical protein RHEC894_CH02113 [Rhizobium sp. CIAT894]
MSCRIVSEILQIRPELKAFHSTRRFRREICMPLSGFNGEQGAGGECRISRWRSPAKDAY